jgi:hypothetical protein
MRICGATIDSIVLGLETHASLAQVAEGTHYANTKLSFQPPEGTVLICNNPVHPSSQWSAAVQLQASQLCDAASTANWVKALPAEPVCIHVCAAVT